MGLGVSAAGLALLEGCAQPFWASRQVVAHVGILADAPHDSAVVQQDLDAFRKGMRDLAWVDGQNVVFHPHYADEGPFPELAAQLVRLPVDVILTGAGGAVLAARDATSTIPIVAMVSDPVRIGLVPSYTRPGGNITGPAVTTGGDNGGGFGPKQVDILASAVPGLAHLAVLFNADNPVGELAFSLREQAASTVGIQTLRFGVRSADEFESAFAQMRAWPAQALLIVSENALINPHFALIADLALRSRLPNMDESRICGGWRTHVIWD